jgi:hypothetical protein
MVIYKICVFGADRKSNMAARAYNVLLKLCSLMVAILDGGRGHRT